MSAPKETAVQEREPPSTVITRTMKEGWVKKRSGRMHQWTNRYFILHDSSLSYKLKQDATTIRGTFNLVPGSVVTDIIEESLVKMKSNKLYSFWIVNPGASKPDKDDEKMYDSDEENEPGAGDGKDTVSAPNAAATSTSSSPAPVNRNLQHIVRNEVNTQKRQKVLAEEQVELHQAHDNTVSQGAYVAAAVAVGGVVVGAMTFGIGLIPYFAVVGITAAASGGVVAFNSRRRPENSRLIMAFESNKEAIEWKAAIEQQIRLVSESRRPMLPDSVDAQTISAILDLNSSTGSVWKRVAVYEGVCVLEHITFEKRGNSQYKYHPMMNFQDQSAFYTFWLRLIMDPEYMKVCIAQQNMLTNGDNSSSNSTGGGRGNNNRVRKAQLSVCCSPGDTFLALMNTEAWCWPSKGTFKVVREIDDHADIIGVEIVTDCTKYGGKSAKLRRRLCLSRFWQLDDDGVYLVTYSSVKDEGFTPSLTMDDISKKDSGLTTTEENNCHVQFDAVVTIAPRHDVANIDSDIPEAMVTCICQVNLQKGNWQKGEVTALMESFLKDNLLELRQTLWNNKYCISRDGTSGFGGGFATAADGPFGHSGLVDRGESNEFYMSGGEGKLGSPTTKASKSSVTSPPVLSPASTVEKKALSGGRGYGVTTVQPGVEDEGGKTPHHSTCDDSVVAAAPPKKRLGFLARMKSSSAVPSNKPPPPSAAGTTSPNGPLRKEMTPNVSTSVGAQNRSVSPLGALLSRGKTTTAIQPAATAAVQGNRSRNSSSDANFDSDYDSESPGPPGKHGDLSPSNSPPSSPVQSNKKSETRVASPPTKRPRDKKTNAEASKLRNVISMTDYEITRLTKSLKKRMGALQTLEAQHHGHSGSVTEEAMHQHTVLEYNTEIQSLHSQIGRLTVRQQGLKDEYLELTGEVFEPSKGTRGMMERWKGARLAAKEIKEMKDKEKGDKLAGTATGGAKIDPFQPQSALPTTTTTLDASAGGRNPAFQLKRSNSGDYYAVNKRTAEDKPQTLRPSHWEPVSPLLVRGDPAARASLIDWFGQMLGTSLESDSVNVSSVRVSKSWAQRSAADAAMKDVRAANLMLVVLFTASFVMATLVASCFAV